MKNKRSGFFPLLLFAAVLAFLGASIAWFGPNPDKSAMWGWSVGGVIMLILAAWEATRKPKDG